MGIEDNSIEFRMETDRYTGNPADYIDDAAEALETFEVGSFSSSEEVVVCAVCKDAMVIGEIGKKLPCGHSYHGNCIVPWLGTRNSCPLF
ncbi:unnamed protein product [Arabis nemorensis]|uniref:RING-type domain-containing protein n=1 Tax=Arabis nemorensis TaxID=586526 RepID=A0A565CWV6_9BRAS|nr:unnamed protein product [Arabis nemorensis]